MQLEVALSDEVSDLVSDRRSRISCTMYLDLIKVRTIGLAGCLAILCKAKRVQAREFFVCWSTFRTTQQFDVANQIAVINVRISVHPRTFIRRILFGAGRLSKITHVGSVVM